MDKIDTILEGMSKVIMDHKIRIEGNTYAVVSLPKTVDNNRAYTYAIVNLDSGKVDHSFCQFEKYDDMLLNLCLHHKLGYEDEMLWSAVCCLIEGRKKG